MALPTRKTCLFRGGLRSPRLSVHGCKMFRKIVYTVCLFCLVPIKGTPTCKTFYKTSVMCEAGEDDYILTRGFVSDNNNTVTIILKSCRITRVEPNALHNYYLKEIDLSRNKIKELELGVLDGIPKLSSLRLDHNYLTTIPIGFFDHSSRLQFLDLGNNFIKTFNVGIFHKLPRLLSVTLDGNGLSAKDLDPLLFQNNPKITTMHFSDNDMSQAPDNLLSALQRLTKLELNNCSLTEMPKFIANASLQTLTLLQLRSNKLNALGDAEVFGNLPNLEVLDLSANSIENLTVDVFKQLRKLVSLQLSFNTIEEIPKNLFTYTPRLLFVDLSYNFIETVPANALRGSRVIELNLNANRIKFFESRFITDLKKSNAKLTTFYFKDNPIQCACLLELLNELKRFHVKYDSDKYDGEHAVCSLADNFICIRERVVT